MPLKHPYPPSYNSGLQDYIYKHSCDHEILCFGYIWTKLSLNESVKNKCSGQIFRIILKIKRY